MEGWQEKRRWLVMSVSMLHLLNDLCPWPKDSWKCPLPSKSLAVPFDSRWDENIFTRLHDSSRPPDHHCHPRSIEHEHKLQSQHSLTYI